MGATAPPPNEGGEFSVQPPARVGPDFRQELGGFSALPPLLPKAVMTPHTLVAISPKSQIVATPQTLQAGGGGGGRSGGWEGGRPHGNVG